MTDGIQNDLSRPLLGKVVQVCMVTSDHERMLTNFVRLGIGPWQILTLGQPRITEALYYGVPHSFQLTRCLALVNGFVWEVIQPIGGTSIFHDFLASRGEGVHHLGMTYQTDDLASCVRELEQRGFRVAMTGLWDDRLRYAFLATDTAIGPFIELWEKPADFVEPIPERWFPEGAEPAKALHFHSL